MGSGKGLSGVRVLAFALVLGVPATVFAHAKLVSPPPRVDDDGIKTGPCGGTPRTASFVQYDAGETITVNYREGIDHSGCFDILFSPANDQNWVRLKRIQDDGGTGNTNFTTTVTLPAGVTCEACTLALRQIMVSSQVGQLGPVCTPTTPDSMDGGPPTYFSCADIRVGDFPDAAPSMDSGTGSSSGGTSSGGTTDTDGGDPSDPDNGATPGSSGGSRNLRSGAGDDGCSVGWGATSGASLFASVALGAAALLRRRRRR